MYPASCMQPRLWSLVVAAYRVIVNGCRHRLPSLVIVHEYRNRLSSLVIIHVFCYWLSIVDGYRGGDGSRMHVITTFGVIPRSAFFCTFVFFFVLTPVRWLGSAVAARQEKVRGCSRIQGHGPHRHPRVLRELRRRDEAWQEGHLAKPIPVEGTCHPRF